MKYFNGLQHSDYQDVLRAIGLWLDTNNFRCMRIMEVEGGLLVQGSSSTALGQLESRMVQRLFTEADIHTILVEAYALRDPSGKGQSPNASRR